MTSVVQIESPTSTLPAEKPGADMTPRKSKKTWLILGLTGTVMGLCLVIGCLILVIAAPSVLSDLLSRVAPHVGSTAPDFTLTSLEGESVRLSQFGGQPVLLCFGTTWCPSCNVNDVLLQQVYEAHPGLVVLLVDGGEPRETVLEWQKNHSYSFPVLLDPSNLIDIHYGVTSIPKLYFIDEHRIIQFILVGETTSETLEYNLPLIGIEP